MEDRVRNLENFAQLSADFAVMMEENLRRMEENQRRMEEDQRRRGELLERLLQAVAVIQAEIVRIDETHS